MNRIALFGGSFDPIHLGHTMLAERAAEELQLNTVFFIPCRQSPHKEKAPGASDLQRSEMIRLATQHFPWAQGCELELNRPEPSYSWQTAEWFAREHPEAELFWILGSDQWDVLETWAKPDVLAALLTFVVFPRGSEVVAKPGFRHHLLRHTHPASASAIRQSPEGAREFLDPAVDDFVQREGLYRDEEGQLAT